MSTHIVGLHRPAQVRLSHVIPFRGTSELAVERSTIRCQPGAPRRTEIECQSCPRFAGWHDAADGRQVRCGWTDRDLVRDCMTYASVLLVTRPQTTCREADELARRHRVQHLVVVDGIWLVGVVSRRDLQGGSARVAERMAQEVFAVLSGATLGEALAAMVALRVGMLPVIGRRFVLGVITRNDLVRVGAPPDVFRATGLPPLTLREASGLHRLRDADEPVTPQPVDDDSDRVVLPDD
jgi:CBS domain-containing protein